MSYPVLTYATDVLGPIVETRTTDAPVFRSATGYGRKIPTSRMVRFKSSSRWRRVYVCCYSNAGTAYVGPFQVIRDAELD